MLGMSRKCGGKSGQYSDYSDSFVTNIVDTLETERWRQVAALEREFLCGNAFGWKTGKRNVQHT